MGTVRIAKHKPSDAYIAIKAIRKDYISKHHDGRHVANEKEALMTINSSFVPACFGM
jgi:serine/threonine protein kinase